MKEEIFRVTSAELEKNFSENNSDKIPGNHSCLKPEKVVTGSVSSDSGQFSEDETHSNWGNQEVCTSNTKQSTSKENMDEGESTEPYTFSSEDEEDINDVIKSMTTCTFKVVSEIEDASSDKEHLSDSSYDEDNQNCYVISKVIYEDSTDPFEEDDCFNVRFYNNYKNSISTEENELKHGGPKDSFGKTNNDNCCNQVLRENISDHKTNDSIDDISDNNQHSGKQKMQTTIRDEHNTSLENNCVQNEAYPDKKFDAGLNDSSPDKKEKVFCCNICDKRYRSKKRFHEHVLAHEGNLPFRCDFCFKGFLFMSDFKRHRQQKRCRVKDGKSENRLLCQICGMKFKSLSTKKVHLKRNHPYSEKKHKNSSSNLNKESQNVEKMNLKEDNRSANIENGVTERFNRLDHATNSSSENKNGLCDIKSDKCDDKTSNATESIIACLEQTQLEEREDKDNAKQELRANGITKVDESAEFDKDKYFNCDVCQRVSSDEQKVCFHHATSPTKKGSPRKVDARYECEICGIKFLSKMILDDHISRHTKQDKGEINNYDTTIHNQQNSSADQNENCFRKQDMVNLQQITENMNTARKPKGSTEQGDVREDFENKMELETDVSCNIQKQRLTEKEQENCAGILLEKSTEQEFGEETASKSMKIDKMNTDDISGNVKPFQNNKQSIGASGRNHYQCDYCVASFKYRNDLERHNRIHTGERPYHCDICDKSFNQSSNYNRHIKKIHEKGSNYNRDIKKIHEKGSNYNRDIKKIHEKGFKKNYKVYKCDLCGKVFGQPQQLQRHMSHHTGDKYRCDICDKEYVDEYCLKRHRIVHSKNKPYKCKYCEKEFNRKECLVLHELKHDGLPSASKKKYGLRLHSCDVCRKSFATRLSLQQHVYTHTGEKPHICDVCGKGFSQKVTLKQHSLLHTDEKPFKCETCGESFKHRALLIRHRIKHTNKYPYYCDICGKGLGNKTEKDIHMAKHSGIKDFSCNICGKRYEHPRLLDSHYSKQHKSWDCKTCGQNLRSKHKLKNHICRNHS